MSGVEIILLILVVANIFLVIWFRPRPNQNVFSLSSKMDDLFHRLDQMTQSMREDFKLNRQENSAIAAQNRQELNDTLREFRREMTETLRLITEQNRSGSEQIHATLDSKLSKVGITLEETNKASREQLSQNLKDFSLELRSRFEESRLAQQDNAGRTIEGLEKMSRLIEERLVVVMEQARTDNKEMRQSNEEAFKQLREGMVTAFKDFQSSFERNVAAFNELQREKFGQLEEKQTKLVESTEKRLEQMRETVEEKLQRTLNERLGQSFELVGKQLESVQKGLGEMQSLAQDVGGLKRVLSNVKMRGGFGEVQLAMLLENILAPDQYEANVRLNDHTTEVVEFAIKMPNRDGERGFVWLAIDAKFPREAYEQLQLAYDNGDAAQVEEAQRLLEVVIRKMAKDICDKYINPPATTDFAIMFLPFEGIYAEVVRKASLLEDIQRQCKVVITGPTTLAAILNSLQMGFRTLAIQKRSGEVWTILGAVKKEFENFGGLLEKAQKNLQVASNQIDEVMGKRTRAIQRKLKGVEALEDEETKVILSDITTKELLDDED